MTNKILTNIILFWGLSLSSQNLPTIVQKLLSDSRPIIKTFGKEQLKDCQVYDKYPQGIDTSILHHSFEFDEKGNIAKSIYSTRWEDTSLIINSYDNLNRKTSCVRYSKSWRDKGTRDTSVVVYTYNKANDVTSESTYERNLPTNKFSNSTRYLYFYNKKNLLERTLYQEDWGNRVLDTVSGKLVQLENVTSPTFSTVSSIEYNYNSKGQKETETSKLFIGPSYFYMRSSVTTYQYDSQDRISQTSYVTIKVRKDEETDERLNFNCYYEYIGDSVKIETKIRNSSLCDQTTYVKNKNKQTIQIVINEEEDIENINYQYDQLGRIIKINSKSGVVVGVDEKSISSYRIYVYGQNETYLLPENEYFDLHRFRKWPSP
jgi:hypothetical protein